ncbi:MULTISPECIES: amidohydrolase family protein [unclassified Maridesulfovibrio]|uniref:amidohydrolase family protein n=1 Tax=unclassified Maridesulfovibrio TaxID=2794999 RepID=UPI003B3C5B30
MAKFIDTHCHLFNLVDVPLYETLDGKIEMNTVIKLLGAISASSALLTGFLQHKIQDYKEFIQFFERPQEENIRALADEILKSTKAGQIILTPLVMDFDCTRHPCGEKNNLCFQRSCPLDQPRQTNVSYDPTAAGQYYRLQKSIKSAHANNPGWNQKVKILPFLGFDLRKLTSQSNKAFSQLQALWNSVGTTKDERGNGFNSITSGKALGIKLYPPIGFNPYPEQRSALTPYKEFYEWCIKEQIPITVHCQTGSFSTTKKKRTIKKNTHASNWYRLFQDWDSGRINSSYDINDLRINFAHFGGENGLEDMIDYWRANNIDQDSWTYILVKLLQNYDNTYADLSAFDWADSGDSKNFATLLKMDRNGKLPATKPGKTPYKLTDKLLWGSDVPMVVSDKSYKKDKRHNGKSGYEHLLNNFQNAVQDGQLIQNMTEFNPEKFLLS